MTKRVTIIYQADDLVKYEVLLDDKALSELIIKADQLAEDSEDRNE